MIIEKIKCFEELGSPAESNNVIAKEPAMSAVAYLKKKVSPEFYEDFLAKYAYSYGGYDDVASVNEGYVNGIVTLLNAGVDEDTIRKLPAHSGDEYLRCREFAGVETFVKAYQKYGHNTSLYLEYGDTPYVSLLIKNNKADWLSVCSGFSLPLQEALYGKEPETAIRWTKVIMESSSCFANFSFLTDCSFDGILHSFDLLLGSKLGSLFGIKLSDVSFSHMALDYNKLLWVRMQMDNRLYKFPLYQILKDSFTFEGFREDHCPRYLIACYGRDDTISIVLSKFPVEIPFSSVDYVTGQSFNTEEINPVETTLTQLFGETIVAKTSMWKLPFIYSAMLSESSWRVLAEKPSLLVLVPWYCTGDTLNRTMTRFLHRNVSSEFVTGDYNRLCHVSGEVINLYDLFEPEKRSIILAKLSEGDINDYKIEKV